MKPTVTAMCAISLLVLSSSPATATDATTAPGKASPVETKSAGEGITEYPSLQAAERAASAEPGGIVAYAPVSGNALVIAEQPGAHTATPPAPMAIAAFSVNCPTSAPYSREVTHYNAAYLGTTYLRCGNANGGYRHISSQHATQWQAKLNKVGSTANWAQFMIWVSRQTFEHPYSGYPKNRPGDKLCYSTPVILRTTDGKINADFNPTVITGQASRFHITSYPTRWANC